MVTTNSSHHISISHMYKCIPISSCSSCLASFNHDGSCKCVKMNFEMRGVRVRLGKNGKIKALNMT